MRSWTFNAGLTMLAADPRPVIFSSSAMVWPLAAEAWHQALHREQADAQAERGLVGARAQAVASDGFQPINIPRGS